jgi:hypothetical protein
VSESAKRECQKPLVRNFFVRRIAGKAEYDIKFRITEIPNSRYSQIIHIFLFSLSLGLYLSVPFFRAAEGTSQFFSFGILYWEYFYFSSSFLYFLISHILAG